MSNQIELRGVITHVALRATSLFMNVREEVRGGSNYQGSLHTVKAYYPKGSNEPPEMWAQKLQHLEQGMTVIVKGKQSFEKETRQDPQTNEYVPVRHPFQDRDLYSPFIWAIQIDGVFDPAIHTKRGQHPVAQQGQRAPATPVAPQQPVPRPQARPPAPHADDELPPLPGSDVAWN
jgi:hypothetical protein